MTGCRTLITGLFAALVVWSAALHAEEQLPTAAQVVDGYRANRAQFPAPHVTIHGTARTSEPMRRHWQSRVAAMQRALADPSRSDSQRNYAQAVLAAARHELDRAGEETYTHLDFWTDRKSWQARVPYPGPDGTRPPAHAFPREVPDADSLARVYRRYRIYTFAAAANPAMSAWLGLPNPGAPAYARASEAVVDELPADFHLPPLGAPGGKTSQLAHPIDAVFFRPGEPLRVAGYQTLGGRRTIRVEQAQFEPSDEPHRVRGNLTAGEVITAWIDPEQGYLPLRVEWHSAWRLDGRALNEKHRPVHAVLRTTRIERVAGGGFYPLEGVIEFRGPQPGGTPAVSIDEMAAGKPYNPQMIPEREVTWRVETVEPQGGADPSIYRVEFPVRTEIFDETRLVAPPRLVPLAVGQAAPELRVTGWTDGAKRSLRDYRGKVVVLYFWMAWQEPCMAPLGVLEAIEKKYGPRGLVVLGVHVGNIELAELRRAMASAGATFPAALDSGTEQTPTSTLAAYRIQLYPTTLILDRQAKVAFSTADQRAGEWSRQAARSLGITFPLPNGLSQEEESRMWNQIYGAMLAGQLERMLESR